MTWRGHCRTCGTAHEPDAHASPDAMEREAARAAQEGRTLDAALWRARAACTRAGRIVSPPRGQLELGRRVA